ncbi:hypothetical protein GN958_ATG07239 [Phytophthora infestans]|uniref:Uncharacterized protein n=1 Tax=Phytophthora infestans TaxID=4787 RepID=A0A8S9URE6_PHYIN|nr:hypothetical protein GN958_ATG07239 [Phytophthora infestans]
MEGERAEERRARRCAQQRVRRARQRETPAATQEQSVATRTEENQLRRVLCERDEDISSKYGVRNDFRNRSTQKSGPSKRGKCARSYAIGDER